jgi:hypothetical protein
MTSLKGIASVILHVYKYNYDNPNKIMSTMQTKSIYVQRKNKWWQQVPADTW